MVKITNLLDLWKSNKIPKYIADSMEEQLLKLCKEWLTYDIGSFGAFFYIEDKSDLDRYRETGMTERIETAEPEFVSMLKDDNGEICYQSCHIIDDGYAIYVFCEHKILKPLNHQDIQNNF